MARSTYIYLVLRDRECGAPGFLGPERAFTVKHELRSWLEGQESLKDLSLFRVRDGYGYGRDMVTEMTLQEVLSG